MRASKRLLLGAGLAALVFVCGASAAALGSDLADAAHNKADITGINPLIVAIAGDVAELLATGRRERLA